MHAGIVAGSIIFTAEGEIPVEYLSPGDKVVTRDSGMVTLLDTFVHRTSAAAVANKAGSQQPPRPQCHYPCRTTYIGARLARKINVWKSPDSCRGR